MNTRQKVIQWVKGFVSCGLLVFIGLFSLSASQNFTVKAAAIQDPVRKANPSYLLQTSPGVTLDKLTNGPGGVPSDGPFILTGQDVTWTYTITNSGDTDLTELAVLDDNGTAGNTGDDFDPCASTPIPSPLESGVFHSCVFTLAGGTQAGQYTNTATVTGSAEDVQVTDSDASSYFGASPSVLITKNANGANANNPPGPTLPVGSTVEWTYIVQNTGNVALTQVSVTDDQEVTVSCPQNALEVAESMTCTASGTVVTGQYSNTGTVSAQPPIGPVVTDTDLAHYFGQGPTNTATATVTRTPTITSTITGTPPTPTATGTITPNPVLTVSVSPLQARVNQSLTFTIRITNPGTAPAFSAVLSDTFPTYVDVISVTFDEGNVSKTTHSVTVNLGDLPPGANTTVTILTRVNSSLPRSQTVSNVATLTYNTNLVRTASVVYSVILSSALPGTGELPLITASHKDGTQQAGEWIWAGFLLGAIFSGWSMGKVKNKSLILIIGGVVLLVVLITAACNSTTQTGVEVAIVSPLPSETSTQTLMPFMPAYRFSTPEVYPTMPDYPIPSPSLVPVDSAAGGNGSQIDTSPIVRVVIPSLQVDALVHYIPFEGHTWPVESLREDIAWLGNSSWPGLGSNTVLAGHVTVKGIGDGPFRYLEDLKKGDEVIVYTEAAEYTYLAREHVTVEDTDLGVTLPTTQAQLTLVTCTGWDTELSVYRYRRVVFADLVKSESMITQGRSR